MVSAGEWSSTLVLFVLVFTAVTIVVAAAAGKEDGIQDGLLTNGDFETVPPGGFSDEASGSATAVQGWTHNGTVELVNSGQKQGAMILIIPGGSHAIRLGNDAEISQDLNLQKGAIYSVTFSAARTCAQLESLNVSVPAASSTVDLQTVYTDQGWDSYAWAFTYSDDDDDSTRLVIKNPGMDEDPTCGPIVDNVAIKKLFTPDRPKQNLVLNGDFEEGPWMFTNDSLGVLLPTNLNPDSTPLPGWIVESNRAVRYVDSSHFSVPREKRAVELLSGKEGIISQTVETTPKKEYTLTFSMGQGGDHCQSPLAIMAFAGDQAKNFHYLADDSNSSSPGGGFQRAAVNFTAKTEKTRIAFYSVYYNTRKLHMSSLCGPVLDDVRVWATNWAAAAATVNRLAVVVAPLLLLFGLLLGP